MPDPEFPFGVASSSKVLERAFKDTIHTEEDSFTDIYPHTVYRFISPKFIGRSPLVTSIRKIYKAELSKNRVKLEEVSIKGTKGGTTEIETRKTQKPLTLEEEQSKIQELLDTLLEEGLKGKSDVPIAAVSTKTLASKRLALLKKRTTTTETAETGTEGRPSASTSTSRTAPGIQYLYKMIGRGTISDTYGNLQGSPRIQLLSILHGYVSALERMRHTDIGREMPHAIEKKRDHIGSGEFPMYHCAGMIKRNLRKDYAFARKLMFSGEDAEGGGVSNPIVRGKNTLSSAFVESSYRFFASPPATSSGEGFTEETRKLFLKACREAIKGIEGLSSLAQSWEVLEILTNAWMPIIQQLMTNISRLLQETLNPKKGGVNVIEVISQFTEVNQQLLDEEQNFERELERSRMILRENRKTKEQKELLRVMKKLQLGEWKSMRDKAKELDEDYYLKTTAMVELQKIQQPGFRGKKVLNEMEMNMELLDDEDYSRAIGEVSEEVFGVEDVDYDV
jgi:hypothetical protein